MEVVLPKLPIMYKLLICAFLLLFLASCRKMKEPVFEGIRNVKMEKPRQGKAVVLLDLAYFNPNKSGAILKNAEGEAWLDSAYLGRFFVDSAISVPSNSGFLIPVRLEVSFQDMLKHSMTAINKDDMLVTIKGKARVAKNGFSKNIPLNYEGRQVMKDLFK
jgi:hypothetical protein